MVNQLVNNMLKWKNQPFLCSVCYVLIYFTMACYQYSIPFLGANGHVTKEKCKTIVEAVAKLRTYNVSFPEGDCSQAFWAPLADVYCYWTYILVLATHMAKCAYCCWWCLQGSFVSVVLLVLWKIWIKWEPIWMKSKTSSKNVKSPN